MKKISSILLLILSQLILTSNLLAFAVHRNYGIAPKATALGGAFTGLADDPSAGWYNPAGLIYADHVETQISYHLITDNLELNGDRLNVEDVKGLGLDVIVPYKILKRKIGLGINVFLPDQWLARVLVYPTYQARFLIYENEGQITAIVIGLGAEILPYLSIGSGVEILLTTTGEGVNINAMGLPDFPLTPINVQNTYIDISGVGDGAIFPTAGIMFKPGYFLKALDDLKIGLSYKGWTQIKAILPAQVSITADMGGFMGFTSEIDILKVDLNVKSAIDFWNPNEVAIGVSYDLNPNLTLLGDMTWRQWSEFPNTAVMVDATISLMGGTPTEISAPPSVDPKFNDTYNPRIGVEYRLHPWTKIDTALRGGYSYEPSPVPDDQGIWFNYLDSNKHVLSIGSGFTFKNVTEVLLNPFSVDLFFQYAILEERTIKEEDPADLASPLKIKGNVFNTGLSITLRF